MTDPVNFLHFKHEVINSTDTCPCPLQVNYDQDETSSNHPANYFKCSQGCEEGEIGISFVEEGSSTESLVGDLAQERFAILHDSLAISAFNAKWLRLTDEGRIRVGFKHFQSIENAVLYHTSCIPSAIEGIVRSHMFVSLNLSQHNENNFTVEQLTSGIVDYPDSLSQKLTEDDMNRCLRKLFAQNPEGTASLVAEILVGLFVKRNQNCYGSFNSIEKIVKLVLERRNSGFARSCLMFMLDNLQTNSMLRGGSRTEAIEAFFKMILDNEMALRNDQLSDNDRNFYQNLYCEENAQGARNENLIDQLFETIDISQDDGSFKNSIKQLIGSKRDVMTTLHEYDFESQVGDFSQNLQEIEDEGEGEVSDKDREEIDVCLRTSTYPGVGVSGFNQNSQVLTDSYLDDEEIVQEEESVEFSSFGNGPIDPQSRSRSLGGVASNLLKFSLRGRRRDSASAQRSSSPEIGRILAEDREQAVASSSPVPQSFEPSPEESQSPSTNELELLATSEPGPVQQEKVFSPP